MKQIVFISILVSALYIMLSSPIAFKLTDKVFSYFKLAVSVPIESQPQQYILFHAGIVFFAVVGILYTKKLNSPVQTVFRVAEYTPNESLSVSPIEYTPPIEPYSGSTSNTDDALL